jgi:hypothetical protein
MRPRYAAPGTPDLARGLRGTDQHARATSHEYTALGRGDLLREGVRMFQRLNRLTAPVTAIAFVALTIVSAATAGSTPDSNASGAHVIAFYEAHRHDQQVSNILFVFAALFLLFFAGSLHGYLRRTPAAATASALMLVGAALLAVGLTVLAGLGYALADVPSHLSPAAAQALNVLSNDVFYTLLVGGCVFGIASAVAILRGAGLPNWLGWIAVLIGIAMATPAFWISAIALFVWVLIVAGLIYFRTTGASDDPSQPVILVEETVIQVRQ